MNRPTIDDNTAKTPEERKELLAAALARAARSGWRIETQGEFQVVVVKGRRVNHVLHLLIALFTVGLWVLVWLIIAITGGEERYLIQVDAFGRIIRTKVGS